MNSVKVNVVYAGGKTLQLNKPFDDVIETVLTADYLKDIEPLKLVFPGTGKVMLFDKDLFNEYHHGGLHYSELIEQTSCDELYRNWLEVEITPSSEIIEPGALWKQEGQILILVDKDRFITCALDNEHFELAN